MAKKPSGKKTGTTRAKDDSNVVRIKADSSAPKKEKSVAKKVTATKAGVTAAEKPKKARVKRGGPKFLLAIGGYFKGAWVELRQVHWPTRRATWSLTGAVLLYSAFFVLLVLLLDALFKYLFELILGK